MFFILCISVNAQIVTKKIWDKSIYSAFTTLVHYDGYFYCAFRTGSSHVDKRLDGNGSIQVIRSLDGEEWNSFALLHESGIDLRDPQLSITPDNKLILLCGGIIYNQGVTESYLSRISFLDSLTGIFSPFKQITIDFDSDKFVWLWKIKWHNDGAYGIIYGRSSKAFLVKSGNGLNFELVSEIIVPDNPSEASIEFVEDKMLIAIRRKKGVNGLIGLSLPPYTEFKWNDCGMPLAGPELLKISNENIILGTRYSVNKHATMSLFKVIPGNKLSYMVTLPSGGDCAYPGMIILGDYTYITYYSSHEGKACIYLSKVKTVDL